MGRCPALAPVCPGGCHAAALSRAQEGCRLQVEGCAASVLRLAVVSQMSLSRSPAQDAFHTGAQSTPAEASTPNLAAVRWLVLAGRRCCWSCSRWYHTARSRFGTHFQGRLLFPAPLFHRATHRRGLAGWLPTGRSRRLACAGGRDASGRASWRFNLASGSPLRRLWQLLLRLQARRRCRLQGC